MVFVVFKSKVSSANFRLDVEGSRRLCTLARTNSKGNSTRFALQNKRESLETTRRSVNCIYALQLF